MFFVVLFSLAFSQIANATIYKPGATLAPDCAPGSINCGVAIFNLNGQTDTTQTLVTGTTGPDFNIVSALNAHTFNIPSVSSLFPLVTRGLLTATDYLIFSGKQNALVSGTNIKMVGGISLLGSGDIPIVDATKVVANSTIVGATKTKITYDAKGLVTAGADATTADIAASTNRNYVTDAGLIVLGNTSGINTGDQTTITGNAGTATALQFARLINGVSFDGTANITVAIAAGTLTGTTLASGITASSLTGVGILTSGSIASGFGAISTANSISTSNNISTTGTGTITSAGLLTGSNGLTLTTGVLNLTGTSGALTLSGLSASSITTSNAGLTLNTGTGTIGISTDATNNTINIGTGGGVKIITIGNNTGATRVNLTTGTGGIFATGLGAAAAGHRTVCIDNATKQLFVGGSSKNCNVSSQRFKHDIADIMLGLDAVNALHPVSYVFNSNNGKNLGFIAEEAALVDERLIIKDEDGLPFALNDMAFIPILTKAIQEQQLLLGNISTTPGLTTLVADIQAEVVHNPITILTAKIAAGTKVLTDFVVARVTAIRGYFDEVFAKKVHTDQICVNKTNGSEACVNGDQLAALLNNIPVSTPTPTCTPPQILVNNVCTNPVIQPPTCIPPQTLVNNVCTNPAPVPSLSPNPTPTPNPKLDPTPTPDPASTLTPVTNKP